MYVIIIIIIKRGRHWKAERECMTTPYQPKDPSPTIATYRQKEENVKNIRSQKEIEQLSPIKNIGPALETRQSHIIEYRVSKIVPEGH